jgi:acetamidase/formamidase
LVFLAGARAARKLGLGERRRAMRGDRDRAVGRNGHSFHAVRPDAFNYVWDNNIKPALEVDSGEVVEFTVRDASDEQIKVNSTFEDVAKLDFEHVNPVSGPVYVKGARPGDVLAIEILEFRPRDWGWTALIPGFGLLADEFPEPWLRISRVEATRGRVVFAEGIELPYEPFPGTIGVAPAEPGPHSIVPPSRWGGNMDTKHLRAGTTLYLPVGVEGALFSVGDTHSAQGDGEVCGTAIETAMEVSLRLSVRRDFRIDAPQYRVPPGALPRAEGTGFHVSTGVASDLMEATRGAVRATMEQLVDRHGLSREEAYALCSVAVDLRIHEVVDAPNWVVGAFLPDDIFTGGGAR